MGRRPVRSSTLESLGCLTIGAVFLTGMALTGLSNYPPLALRMNPRFAAFLWLVGYVLLVLVAIYAWAQARAELGGKRIMDHLNLGGKRKARRGSAR